MMPNNNSNATGVFHYPTPIPTYAPPPGSGNGYTMQSLSHVAGVKLQSPSVQPLLPTAQPTDLSLAGGTKQGAEELRRNDDNGSKESKSGIGI